MRRLPPLTFVLACLGVAPPAQAQDAPAGVIRIEEPVEWQGVGTRGLEIVPNRSVRVVGTAAHPAGVARVTINGRAAALEPVQDGSTRFLGYLGVTSDAQEAVIEAVTSTGAQFSARYPLEPLTPPADTPAVQVPEQAFEESAAGFTGQRWAVVVGISQYRDPRITPLQYADADAKSVYDFLRSERAGLGGFKPENVRVLLNEAATFVEIRKALFDFLKGATEDDVVYIYFAGHGSPDPDRPENLYLIPYDADADNLGGTGLPMEDVNTAIRRLYARHVVVITDACHSAGVSAGGAARNLALNQINRAFLEQMEYSRSVMASFTASEASQYSQEGPQWGGGHGVFTYYLLEALKGQADGFLSGQPDHIVSLGEMMEWTRERVRRETRNAQVPSIGPGAFDRNWPMAVVLPGTEIPAISMDEIEKYSAVSTLMASAYDSPWRVPDSLITFVGAADTVRIRVDAAGDLAASILPPNLLSWSSSNAAVARVDSTGVVRPVGPGAVTISASGFNRRVTVPVRVYERPTEVVFTPPAAAIELVSGESISIRADLLLGADRWIRGVTPSFAPVDSAVVRAEPGGRFVALREGEATLAGRIAGELRRWTLTVRAPLVRIERPYRALPLGDSLPLAALRTRPDGSVLGQALAVEWTSLDTSIVVVRGATAHARGMGSTQVRASLGTAEDTTTLYVLGDLLVTVDGADGPEIHTLSLQTEKLTRIGPPSLRGWSPALSPDGGTIAYASKSDGGLSPRIHLMNPDGTGVRRLTPEMRGSFGLGTPLYQEHSPAWQSRGDRIAFVSNSPGNYEILSVGADGSSVQQLTFDGALDRRVAAAPDVPRIAFERLKGSGDADIVVALPDGGEQVTIETSVLGPRMKHSEGKPAFLPGGTQLLYTRGGPRLDNRAGETLAIYDLANGRPAKDLVQPLRDHELLYAVSPDGQRIAYHQRALWGRRNGVIVILAVDGTMLQTVNLGQRIRIRDLSWGGHVRYLAHTEEP